jgi:hypothetical protein
MWWRSRFRSYVFHIFIVVVAARVLLAHEVLGTFVLVCAAILS